MRKQDYYNDFFEIGEQKINFSFFELSFEEEKKRLDKFYITKYTKQVSCRKQVTIQGIGQMV